MAFPDDLLHNPQWHAQPIEQREKSLAERDPEFAGFAPERRRRILEKAAQKFGQSQAGPPPGPPQKETVLEGVGKDLSIGFRSGVASLEKGIGSAAGLFHAKDVEQKFKQLGEELQPKEGETRGRTGLASQVVQGIGAAPGTIVKYLPAELAGKYAPLAAGVIGAVSSADKGWAEALKEGAKDAITFGAMGKAAALPSRATRAAGSAIAAGGTQALFGGDVKESAAAAIMGGGFGAVGGESKKRGSLTPEKARQILDGGVDAVAGARDFIRQAIGPQNRGPEAKREAGIIRANNSEINRQSDIADYALHKASKEFSRMPDEARMSVIKAIEDPKIKLDPKMQEFVTTMRDLHNQVRDEMIEAGSFIDPKTGEKKYTALKSVKESLDRVASNPDEIIKSYYENFFPHLFTDPEKAAEIMRARYSGKRPLSGTGEHLHQRVHATIEDALWKHGPDGKILLDEAGQRIPTGLKLITTDPVETYMLKWRDMKRFTAGLKIASEMEQDGLLQWIQPGKQGPQGWKEIHDSHAFKRSRSTGEGSRETTAVAWAPEQAARVLNNYLSPGLRGHKSIGGAFRGIMAFNNVLNQAQLGFSAFHLGFTSVDAVTSKFALGLEQVVEGLRSKNPAMVGKGVGSLTKSATVLPALVENLRTGRKMRDEWRKPGSGGDPETARLVALMQESGGGMSLDPVYRTDMSKRLNEVMREHGSYVGGLLHDPTTIPKTLLAANEKFAEAIMNNFVPLQKMGVFADLMRFEMERLPEGSPRSQVREVGGKVWDSVDNRMGMLRYDNLFWEKWIKDMAMVTFRSVGWNLGTLRELGGGAHDWATLGKDFAQGRHAEFTHRMAYTLALPAVAGMMGGMIHYMYTGQAPKDTLDWFFPKTGRKDEFGRDDRISVPSYIKDIYHMYVAGKDLATGAGGAKSVALTASKIHSTWGVIADMLANRDFYNTEIANADDPMMKKGLDYTKFLLKQYSPFSWQNLAKENKLGYPVSEQVGTFFGFIPAPSDLKKTAAERMATELQGRRLPQAPSTRAQREKQDNRRELERRIRASDHWEEYAQKSLQDGTLNEDDITYSANRAVGLPLDRVFRRIQISDAVKVYNVSNAEEKQRLWPILKQRMDSNPKQIQNAMDKMDEAQKKKFAKQLLEILQSPPLSAPPGQ